MQDALECIFVECVYVYMLVWRLLKGKCHSVSDFLYSTLFLWSRKVQSVLRNINGPLVKAEKQRLVVPLYLVFHHAREDNFFFFIYISKQGSFMK